MGIYWSLQTVEAWELACAKGYLTGNKEFAAYDCEYVWMIGQMKNRLGPYIGEFPIWLWLEKPDMRSASHFNSSTECVRLKIELDSSKVLLSDFNSWITVLNNGFCADNELEYENYYSGKLSLPKKKSWERIFDLERQRDPEWVGSQPQLLQGVTDRIELDKIQTVEFFTSRKYRLEN